MSRRRTALPLLIALWAALAPPAAADVGPEQVLLVVNGDSVASRTVANHYAEVRGVAGAAVVTLRDLPDWAATDVDAFRDRILRPALAAAAARGLAGQVACIVYAPAVPTKIALNADVATLEKTPNKVFTPYGSLTGLTTLAAPVLQKRPAAYMAPAVNPAYAVPEEAGEAPASRPFRGRSGDEPGEPDGDAAVLLSGVLGVTTGRGETVTEAVRRVRVAAAADGTRPAGTVAFCDTKDVRSTTRQPLFAAAAAAVNSEAAARGFGVNAEVVTTALPRRTWDLVGLTAGLPGVSDKAWRDARVGFAPGAFADNLTSFGGVLDGRHGQVTAVDWRRFGAAAAGGTVHEPYAVPFKFPTPFVHLHRLRGLTLGEAVVRSVSGPYQYLLVGDPLANPYAARPRVRLDLPASAGLRPLSGAVPATLSATDADGTPSEGVRWELYVDGRRVTDPRAGRSNWDLTKLPDGTHTVVAVAVAEDGARGRAAATATVRNAGRRLILRAPDGAEGERVEVPWGERLVLELFADGFAPDEREVIVRHGIDRVAAGRLTEVPDAAGLFRGDVTVDTRPLGLGPVTLHAEVTAVGKDSETAAVRSTPVRALIVAPANRRRSVAENERLADGPTLRHAGRAPVPLPEGSPDGGLAKAGVPADTAFTLTAVVTVADPGLHRLALRSNCGVSVAAGGAPAPALTDPTDASSQGKAWRSVPLWLARGRHRLTLSGRTPAAGRPVLDVRWGRLGSAAPTAAAWRHVAD